MKHWVKWCIDEISKADVISGNICAAKFPLLQTVLRRGIRRGTVSARWPRHEPLCFALRRTLCSNVCAPVVSFFVNVCLLCIIPSLGQLIMRLPVLQHSARYSWTFWRSRLFPHLFFFLLCCHTFLCLLCVTDWTVTTVKLWLPAHINSVKFQGCLCLFKSKVSLKWCQKVQMWD